MASSKPTTSVNLDGPSVQRSAEPGASASGDQEPFKALDETCAWVKAKWEEERRSERQTISTLEKRVQSRERVIGEQKTVLGQLQTELTVKERTITQQQARAADSQRRIQELQTRLAAEQRRVAEVTARNAKLLQVAASFRGAFAVYAQNRDVLDQLMNSQGDGGHPDAAIPAVVPIPAPVMVAAAENPVVVGRGAAESATAAPHPTAPELPLETVAEHVEIDTAPPLPGADDPGVDTPPVVSSEPSPEPSAAPPPCKSILVTPPKTISPALVYRASTSPSPSEEPRPAKKTVTFSALPVPLKRKRAETLAAGTVCPVCLLEYGDAGELRRHACPLRPSFPCTADGCHDSFQTESGRRRHARAVHGE
ncbi:formin-like protein 1 isoform X2 [Paramacrobiotus metropolitanus]|nr:formin-like protein 1 isoform X2 [Paramacrobiotus metropolitanus]